MVYHKKIQHPSLRHNDTSKEKQYFWIWAMSEESGKAIIFGCRATEQEAEQVAARIRNADVEITPLPTKDEQSASRMLRAIKLDKTGDVDKTLSRFSHRHM